MVLRRAGLGDARLDLRDQLRFATVAGEVGDGGAAVTRQGGGEALELEVSLARDGDCWVRVRGLTEQGGTAGSWALATAARTSARAENLYIMMTGK